MAKYNLFSVGLITTALSLFYATSLIGRGNRISGLPKLIGTFIRAPRTTVITSIAHDQGHAYVAEINLDTTDRQTGVSPFMVLENGVPLKPFPHVAVTQADTVGVGNIRTHGGGRHLHHAPFIIFSPSDNADLRQVPPRKYELLETLTSDPTKIEALNNLNTLRDSLPNPGFWMMAKLQVYAGAILQVERIEATGHMDVNLYKPRVDLEIYGLPVVKADRVAINWTADASQPWNRIEAEIHNVAAEGLPANSRMRLVLGYTAKYRLRLEALELTAGDKTWLHIALDWQDDRLQTGKIHCADVAPLRSALADACGGIDMQQQWITSFIAAIRKGDLSFGAPMDAATGDALVAAFSPDGTTGALTLRLTRDGDTVVMAITAGEAA